MSVSRLFNPAGLRVGATYLGHVGEQSVDNGLEDVTIYAGGSAYPNFTGSKLHAPEYQVDTLDLVAALSLMTEDNLCADLTSANVDLFFRELKPQGIHANVETTSKHQIYRLEDNALLYWDSLQARQGDDAATLALRVVPIWNGSNSIIQFPAEAIPAAAAQVAPFTIGPVWVNGTKMDGITSVQWQNNVQVQKTAADGEAVPSHVSITQVRPVITIETGNLRDIAALAAEGLALTDLQIFLRRRKPSLLNYADEDAQHILLSANAGTWKWRRASGSPASASMEIHLHGAPLFGFESGKTIAAVTTSTTTTSGS